MTVEINLSVNQLKSNIGDQAWACDVTDAH